MNEDYGFEYLSEEKLSTNISKNEPEKTVHVEEINEFINGLPDWDLEPPFELVRRQQL